MDVGFLISTQLSSLSSLPVVSIPLQTVRQDIPLPQAPLASDPPAEHATFSSILNTTATGTVLLRVLHSGLIIELVSLSTDVPPIRFVFPSPILSFPAVFLWEDSEIHVLAVIDTGSLYRIVLPIGHGLELWQNQISNIWPREYLINNPISFKGCLVHVHGVHCVVIALQNGSLLRLENDYVGEGSYGEWKVLFE